MENFSSQEQSILVQYAIKKYENEETIIEKLKAILSEKEIPMEERFGSSRLKRATL